MKKLTQYVATLALFLVPIFPLIVSNSLFFPFITGKAFFFRIVIEIAFAAWVILAFIDPKYRPKISPLTITVTLFAVIALIADLLGVNPLRSIWSNFERMEGWVTVAHLWAFFIMASSMFGADEDGRKLWHRWLNVSLTAATVVALYGLMQLFGWAQIHQGSNRLDATLGNSAYLAVYMLFHAFLAAYFFFVARARRIMNADILQWVYPILAVLFSFIILETQTRGTILGYVAGVLVALAVYAIFGKKESSKSRLWAAGGVAFVIVFGIVFWSARNTSLVRNTPVLNRIGSISLEDVRTQARQYVWPMAIHGSLERPIFGWGQENFNYIFNANYNPAMWSQEQWFDRAHNVFLDWLVASGFIGLIAYLALYVLGFVAIWKSSLSFAEKSALTGLLVGYIVHNIFVFDNLASYVMFFAMLAFVGTLRGGKPARFLGTNPMRMDAVEYIVAPIVLIVLVVGGYFVDVRPLQANTHLITALNTCTQGNPDTALFEKALGTNAYVANQEIREQLLQCTGSVLLADQAPAQLKQSFYSLAMQEIQAQAQATPNDARGFVLAGAMLNAITDYKSALPLLERAHALSPEKQTIDFELATDYLNGNRTDDAVALLKHAYESAPDFDQAKSAYAIALVVAGKETQAHAELGNDPALFQSQQMARVYMTLKKYPQAIAIMTALVKADPTNSDNAVLLAQAQYAGNMPQSAISTLRDIVLKNHPEMKAQVDAAIQQIQKVPYPPAQTSTSDMSGEK